MRAENEKSIVTKPRKVYLDLMKLVAIFMVYFTHTGAAGSNYFEYAKTAWEADLSIVLKLICRAGPMLFFFISGALLLNREFKVDKSFFMRVAKFAIVILLADIFQIIINTIRDPAYLQNGIGTILKCIYCEDFITQYWFLHVYLAFLCMLPLLQKMAQNMDDAMFKWLFGLYFAIEIVLAVAEFFWQSERIALDIPLLQTPVILPLMGYYFEHRITKEAFCKKDNLILVNAACIAAIAVERWFFPEEINALYIATVYAVYWNLRALFIQMEPGKKLAATVRFFAEGSLIIYLIETQAKEATMSIHSFVLRFLPWYLAVFLWIAIAVLLAGVIAYGFRWISGLLHQNTEL